MKYLICSDIHGSFYNCRKIIDQFNSLKCDFLIILGDILYHGPRNELPEGHDPKMVAVLLNELKDKIIACRGNCDCEVDQMVLDFPCMQDYSLILDDGIKIFCTHGHLFTSESKNIHYDVFFSGHTHIQVLERGINNCIVCNPGSISLPKASSSSGFAIYEDSIVTLYDIDGTVLKTMSL